MDTTGKKNRMLEPWGAYVITSGDAAALAEEACEGGAKIIQFREKAGSRREILSLAQKINAICRAKGALFVVNDYLDIALIVGAHGVHLGQDDIPIREARRITPEGFIIGCSTHSLGQALAAEESSADYIGIGPVFANPTKLDYPPIGLEVVRSVVERVKIPAVALGGINLENIQQVIETGIANIAMVRGFAHQTRNAVKEVNRRLSIR